MVVMTDTNFQLAQANAEVEAAQAQLAKYEAQISALSQESADKRRKAQEAFRTKYAEMFKDVNVAAALSGAPAKHQFTIGYATYTVTPPTGELGRLVHSFTMSPLAKDKDGKEEDVGPVTPAEMYLLKWLSSAALNKDGQTANRQFDNVSVAQKIKLARSLNETVMQHIAERCKNLETYLNVCLELDLGNF